MTTSAAHGETAGEYSLFSMPAILAGAPSASRSLAIALKPGRVVKGEGNQCARSRGAAGKPAGIAPLLRSFSHAEVAAAQLEAEARQEQFPAAKALLRGAGAFVPVKRALSSETRSSCFAADGCAPASRDRKRLHPPEAARRRA